MAGVRRERDEGGRDYLTRVAHGAASSPAGEIRQPEGNLEAAAVRQQKERSSRKVGIGKEREEAAEKGLADGERRGEERSGFVRSCAGEVVRGSLEEEERRRTLPGGIACGYGFPVSVLYHFVVIVIRLCGYDDCIWMVHFRIQRLTGPVDWLD
ncbi:hypothetical protein GUJ93_ZPchr0004g40260 [Zizania palustris]|uniref:Uncharacterized protein n=1 Tax=Zizania palustris TaxID=103762 RepID=A0A8J5S6R7_ZIZPA|nr:hypothetical protein GUJ93_ZPchr0004g40260 [Zizania palustris]